MRASVGASTTCFRFMLTVRFTQEGLAAAEIVTSGEVDEQALDRIRECVEALTVIGRSRVVKAFELHYLVAVSNTYIVERMRREVEEVTSRLLASCPSFREPWERYTSRADYDRESLYMAEMTFANHAIDLVAEGRAADIAAPLAEIQELASTGEAWALEARRVLFVGIIENGRARGVEVSDVATILPPDMLPAWRGLWDSRDDDLSHDPYA